MISGSDGKHMFKQEAVKLFLKQVDHFVVNQQCVRVPVALHALVIQKLYILFHTKVIHILIMRLMKNIERHLQEKIKVTPWPNVSLC